MADIQNAIRQGTGQTWKEAYEDVDKTVASLRDLNEDFTSFVADYHEFSEERRQRLQEYMETLGDIPSHWKEVNRWIEENSDSTSKFTGGLSDVRSIFHDIVSLTGGYRRETQERLNLVRRVERLAEDSISSLQQESGLSRQIVEQQRRKGTSLREQIEYRTKLLAVQDLELTEGRRINLDSEYNRQTLKDAKSREEDKLAVLQRQLNVLQAQRSTGESRSLIRTLQQEIEYRRQNIELLDLENLKALQGEEEILRKRKERLRAQRLGSAKPVEEGGAGPNAFAAAKVDAVTKLLSKASLKDAADLIKDSYNRWITERIAADEALETATRALERVKKETESRQKDIIFRVGQALTDRQETLSETKDGLQKLLSESAKSLGSEDVSVGKFGALTDDLQDKIFKYQELKKQQEGLRTEIKNLNNLKDKLSGRKVRILDEKEKELVEARIQEIDSKVLKLQTDLDSLESVDLAGPLKSRFEGFDFGEDTLESINKSLEYSNTLEEKLQKIQTIQKGLGKKRKDANYWLGFDLAEKIEKGADVERIIPKQVPGRPNLYQGEGGKFAKPFTKEEIEHARDWSNSVKLGGDQIKNIIEDLKTETGIELDISKLSEEQVNKLLEQVRLDRESLKISEQRKIDQDAANAALEAAQQRKAAAEQFKDDVFKREFKLVTQIRDVIKGTLPLQILLGTLALAFYHHLLKFDEEAVKTKRVIGQWADASALANTKFVTGTEVLKTMRELGEQFHINPVQVFSSEELGRIAQAQKFTGMTSEAAGNLAVQSKIIGKNADTYRDEIAKGANQANKLNHSAINLSAVQNDVLNTSRAITLSYGKNTEGLARAAAAAAAIGTNLQGVENIAKNLMNFESSIESEMQAQLLTGMQLNLAKAREYALNNDLEGVAREVSRQGMDAARFSHMNYIQQENMAKALGMSREEMSKMLIMQEINRGLTSEQVAAMTGMRKEDVEALSAQEKWQTMKQRFLEALVPLLEPVLQLTTDILIPVTRFVLGPLTWLAGLISRIGGLVKENNVVVRGLVGLLAIGLPVALIKGIGAVGLLGKAFKGIAKLGVNIGKSIAGWIPQLTRAGKSAQATGGIFSRVLPQRDYQGRTARQRLRDIRKLDRTKTINPVGRKLDKTKTINPAGAAATSRASSSMGSAVSRIGKNIGKIALGAAAAVLIAGAVFILAKAAQEFMKVSWGGIGKAVVGMLALVGGVAALGAIMSSGIGTVMVLAGAAAMTVMAGAVALLGVALKQFEGITWETLGKLPAAMVSLAAVGALALVAGPALALGAPLLLAGSLALLGASLPFRAAMKNLATASGGELENTATGIRAIAGAVGELGVKLSTLEVKKINALGRSFRRLQGLGTRIVLPIREAETAVDQISRKKEDSRESLGNKKENIETSVQEITIKQAQVRASAQQISVEQKAADLSKIEKKLDNVIAAIVQSRPDWDWLEFKREFATNM